MSTTGLLGFRGRIWQCHPLASQEGACYQMIYLLTLVSTIGRGSVGQASAWYSYLFSLFIPDSGRKSYMQPVLEGPEIVHVRKLSGILLQARFVSFPLFIFLLNCFC